MVRTSVLGIGAAVALAIAGGAFLLFETTATGSMHVIGGGAWIQSACSPDAVRAWSSAPRPAPDAQYELQVSDGERVEITVPAGDHYVEIGSSGAILREAPSASPACSDVPEVRTFYAAGSGTATVKIWSIPGP